MIRILVRVDNACMAANVGGSVETTFRTFDVDIPALEAFLRAEQGTYAHANVLGIELLDDDLPAT